MVVAVLTYYWNQCEDARCVTSMGECKCNSTVECEDEIDVLTVKPVTVSYTFPSTESYTVEVIFISSNNEV